MAREGSVEELDVSTAANLVEFVNRLRTLSIGIESPLLKQLADRMSATQVQRLREDLRRIENEAHKGLAYLDTYTGSTHAPGASAATHK